MAEELQSLLDKINAEGVQKAEAEAARIIETAKKQAQEIRSEAEAAAAATVKDAAEQAAALESRAEAAIKQAARDVLLQLQSELQNRIEKAVAGAAEQALTPQFMTELIRSMAAQFAADPAADVTVLTAAKDASALEGTLKAALANSFKQQPKVLASAGVKGGMEVSFQDGKLYFDFTSDAITELVAAYIGPRLGAMIKD